MNYVLDETGIHRPRFPVAHRNDEYDEGGFDALLEMQARHFWYVGRHKFLSTAVDKHLAASDRSVIDLGGGVGGWVKYLSAKSPARFAELALGDSSEVALAGARSVLPSAVALYHVDLMNLQWQERWDVIFLLDVIEHCPDDRGVLAQAGRALKPGGKLIVTTPALMYFWSRTDEYSQHLRRYCIADFQDLAARTGLALVDARYFMFFLSPLYWISRKTGRREATPEELEQAVIRQHRVPGGILNRILGGIFCAEHAIGNSMHFPWGTSILGVFEKPRA